ncbi:MAG: hypothetical protein KAS51_02425 [Candidatus Omnitrophica bacterium]|nr:hypothetical protein [Candidatus Omnitrophota bacterium]
MVDKIMKKEKKKFLRKKISAFVLKILISVGAKFSAKAGLFIGGGLGVVAYYMLIRHRKVAMESLTMAFPEKSLSQRKKIARECFIFLGQGFFDVLYFLDRETEVKNNIRVNGEANLVQGLVKNRGAIILTAHLGNFPLIALKLAKMGYTVNLVIRPMREKNADKYFHKLRDRGGVRTIKSYPRKECVSKILKALKNNELVVLLMDQNFGTGGVWVKFFNILAATPIGAVVLGLRTGTAIMPSYIYQEKAGRHCLRILPEFELIKTENNDETILLNVIKISRLMEDWIRKYVNQWTWIHRRWKSRPSKEILNSKFKVEK